MIKTFSNIISVVFHPLLMPLYTVFLILNSNIYIGHTLSGEVKNMIYGVVFLNTCFMPALFSFFLYKRGLVSSLAMENRLERSVPFFVVAIFYYITYYLLDDFNFPHLITAPILGASITIFLLFGINFFSKISAHLAGVGGLIAVVFGISEFYLYAISAFLFPAIVIAGVIAFARLWLKSHIPKEIYLGLLLGFCCEYLVVFWW